MYRLENNIIGNVYVVLLQYQKSTPLVVITITMKLVIVGINSELVKKRTFRTHDMLTSNKTDCKFHSVHNTDC